ncbi:hypothetical protein F0562_035275 [Nyssa sinensis]|uniref:F-box domain-containing protein n=1 Tax=Nyssa sinensis TaxID=561372 RepID=A0A5J5ADQ7_9ASTE|nr:hypothetical protein F0562_035275 [Nyssa sinensis]
MVEIEEVGDESSVLSYGDGEEVDRRGEVMETTGKKRKKRRKRETRAERKGAELHRDPLIVLGSDTMMMILRQLDARSVALSLLISRGWHGVASSDLLWSIKGFTGLFL